MPNECIGLSAITEAQLAVCSSRGRQLVGRRHYFSEVESVFTKS